MSSIITYIINCMMFHTHHGLLRLALQVTDVLTVAIKELRSNSSNRQNVVK